MDSSEKVLKRRIYTHFLQCRSRGSLSISYLAKETGYSRQKIYDMMNENSSTEITLRFLKFYAKATDTSINYWLTEGRNNTDRKD